jgi:hypothetical protein
MEDINLDQLDHLARDVVQSVLEALPDFLNDVGWVAANKTLLRALRERLMELALDL